MTSYRAWIFISAIAYLGVHFTGDYIVMAAIHKKAKSKQNSEDLTASTNPSHESKNSRKPSVLKEDSKVTALRSGFDIMGNTHGNKSKDQPLPPSEFEAKVSAFNKLNVQELILNAAEERDSNLRVELLNKLQAKVHGQLLTSAQQDQLKQIAHRAKHSENINDSTAFELSLNLLMEAQPNPDDQAKLLAEFGIPIISDPLISE